MDDYVFVDQNDEDVEHFGHWSLNLKITVIRTLRFRIDKILTIRNRSVLLHHHCVIFEFNYFRIKVLYVIV